MRSKQTLKPSGKAKPAATSRRTITRRARARTTRSAGEISATRERLLEATLSTLRSNGFVGTTVREIARTGTVNQALIFYYFGSLDRLLLAALDLTSSRRLARYQAALATVTSLAELIEVMRTLYAEDVQVGHVAAVQEMIAGGSSIPALRQEVVSRMGPWVSFAESVINRLLKGTALESLLPTKEMAYAAVALYFGMETITHLDGDRSKAETLFKTGAQFASFIDALMQMATRSEP